MPDHFYTTSQEESYNASHGGYNFEGTPCNVYLEQVDSTHIFHRLRHLRTGNHFYTTDDLEAENAVGNLGYTDEGNAGWVYVVNTQPNQPNVIPLYRAYNPRINDHFYTTNWQEFNNAILHGGYGPEGVEGVCCYVLTPDNPPPPYAGPLYRLFHG